MKRSEIKELLENLTTSLRSDIESAIQSLADAKSIASKVKNLHDKASNLVNRLEDPATGSEAKLKEGTGAVQKIHDSVAQVESSLSSIEADISIVQSSITTMKSYSDELDLLKTKFDDPSTGFSALLESAKTYKTQTQSAAAQASDSLSKIDQNLTSVQQNITTMQTAYADFQAITVKIDDKDSGLNAILQNSQSLFEDLSAVSKDSETIYKEILRYKDSASKNIDSIEAIKDSSQIALTEIEANKKESDSLKDNISNIFEIVSQSGHANYFDGRRLNLFKASIVWLVFGSACIVTSVILGFNYIAPFVEISDPTNVGQITIEALILRLSLITPVLALGIFSITNFSKERRLSEQYAFKAVSAITIEGSVKLLDRSLKNVASEIKDEKIACFAVDTLKCIHTEPQELIKLTKLKINSGNKLVQMGAELSESIDILNKNIQEIDPRKS
jgi:hypothetical protein